jgi:hypothetical protein
MKANLYDFVENKDTSTCAWKGCTEEGKFPAPKSPHNSKDRYHFCLGHVRQYNKSWNFFRGMDDKEVESFQIDSITGHRPTAKMGVGGNYYNTEELRKKILHEFMRGAEAREKPAPAPKDEVDALEVLGLRYPSTLKEVKRKYKELAKLYHPDVNGQKDEEKLKVINQAYSLLKRYFK